MKIYIASSWKNSAYLLLLTKLLRQEELEIDCFADDSSGRYVFNAFEIIGIDQMANIENFLDKWQAQKAFDEDKKWLDWCDCCLMVLPAGKSSHLEAGYAKGNKKKLIIFAPYGYVDGEFDVMYGFADLITDDYKELIKYLNKIKSQKGKGE